MIISLFLSKAIAGYLLALPVLAVSAAILFPVRSGWMRLAAASGTLLLVLGIVLMVRTPVGESALGGSQAVSSRVEMAETTMTAIAEFLPFGPGLGTFQPVYKLFEDQARIESVFVNHAHNEYLEIALELGIGGVILLLAFLAWWSRSSWRAWRIDRGDPYARTAVIASAVLLAHSAVEFPLRSVALSAVFGLCLALIVARRRVEGADKSQLWPTRHVVLD